MALNYPVSVFHFQVEWGGSRIGFTEASGLTVELQSIDYREGNSKEYQVTKMPGIPQFSNITLKRGMFRADNEFFQWLNTVKLNEIERRDITISLLNEEHEPVGRNDTQQGQRDGRHDNQRNAEIAELPHHQYINQHQCHHKGRTHVSKSLVGHGPLARPFERRLGIVGRRTDPE